MNFHIHLSLLVILWTSLVASISIPHNNENLCNSFNSLKKGLQLNYYIGDEFQDSKVIKNLNEKLHINQPYSSNLGKLSLEYQGYFVRMYLFFYSCKGLLLTLQIFFVSY